MKAGNSGAVFRTSIGAAASGANSDITSLDASQFATATAYTPTLSAYSGTFTSASATGRYIKLGKLVYVYVKITITTNGSAAGYIAASLPFAPATDGGLSGIETTATGAPVFGQILASTGLLYPKRMDGTTTGLLANNVTVTLSGVYECT